MIFISNLSFTYVILFILAYNVLQLFVKKKEFFNWFLLIGSMVVLNTVSSLESIGIIVFLSAFVFETGQYISRAVKSRRLILNASIGLLILLFCLKNYSLANFDLVQRLGLSYILFRLIHFLIDSYKGHIKEYNGLSFINYVIFFPTFIAGPIDRYNNFNYWIKQKRSGHKITMLKAGIFKLTLGIVKKFFFVPIIVSYSTDFSLFEQDFVWQEGLAISLVLYSFYILLDFSGYSDIAIGTAYLIGIKTPENFDNPYGAKNLSIFWKKWHMTFSNFLFKYVFKPLVTFLSKHLHFLPRLFVSSIGYILTFILCGIWHGNTINFIYWGLWHGVGLILFKLWDTYIFKKRITNIGNKFFRIIYNGGAILITFCFVTIGWFFFNYSQGDIHLITKKIASKNASALVVTPFVHEGTNCFQLDYKAAPDAKLIDIEYEVADSSRPYRFYDVPVKETGTYYFATELLTTELLAIRIRSKSANTIGDWSTAVTYPRFKPFEQTVLQEALFGKYENSEESITAFDSLMVPKLELADQYLYQDIVTESRFIDGYGWAIQVNYLADTNSTVAVELKYEDENWAHYTDNRDGQYSFVHVHGKSIFNNTNRNMEPGNYQIRIRYAVGVRNSDWLYTTATVPNYYVNE